MPSVISANRLRDGAVVYLTSDEGWSRDFEEAWVLSESNVEKAGRVSREAEQANLIVESYAVDVNPDTSEGPIRLRERIRRFGPTVGDHQTRPAGGPEG